MTEHPLNDLHVLPAPALAALRERWIVSAEQFLALAASPEGQAGLRRLLGLDGPALDALVVQVGASVAPEARAALAAPAPGRKLGLILPTKDGPESPTAN